MKDDVIRGRHMERHTRSEDDFGKSMSSIGMQTQRLKAESAPEKNLDKLLEGVLS
jgi:hypothetical protein